MDASAVPLGTLLSRDAHSSTRSLLSVSHYRIGMRATQTQTTLNAARAMPTAVGTKSCCAATLFSPRAIVTQLLPKRVYMTPQMSDPPATMNP
jgi:hypothetical protein